MLLSYHKSREEFVAIDAAEDTDIIQPASKKTKHPSLSLPVAFIHSFRGITTSNNQIVERASQCQIEVTQAIIHLEDEQHLTRHDIQH